LTEQGEAYAVGAGYIFNQKVGWGQFQPFIRHQNFDADSGTETERTDYGVAYIIDGYNAQVSARYSDQEVDNPSPTSDSDTDIFAVELQLQF